MSEFHTGGCHCGEIRYRARLELSQIIACNCSICSKQGLWLTLVPEADFTLLSGEDALKEYLFHKRAIHHYFCPECGVEVFGRSKDKDGKDMVAVNVRCIDGIDVHTLTPMLFDGKSL